MNWLDWAILIVLAAASLRGFARGFIVELASLVALIAGIWVATHFSSSVATAIGLDPAKEILAFVVTFLLVLIGVHLLARFLTTLLDAAELGLPNKLAGIVFGVLRSAFTLSIALNLLLGYSRGDMPPKHVQEGSQFFEPLLAFAPLIIPALGETKWVQDVLEEVKERAGGLADGPACPRPCTGDGSRPHRRDPWQNLAFQELQHRTAAGAHIAHLVRHAELVHRCHTIAAAHQGEGAVFGRIG